MILACNYLFSGLPDHCFGLPKEMVSCERQGHVHVAIFLPQNPQNPQDLVPSGDSVEICHTMQFIPCLQGGSPPLLCSPPSFRVALVLRPTAKGISEALASSHQGLQTGLVSPEFAGSQWEMREPD